MSRVVAVVGPSGAGKDLLMTMAARAVPDLRLARRVITRPTDSGAEDFEGVTPAEFDRRIRAGDFALHWQAHGLGYGIPKSQLQGDGIVLFNASRAVLGQAARQLPGLSVIVVSAPAHILAQRLASRGRETAADQSRRLARPEPDLPAGLDLRHVLNDASPETGLQRFLAALQPESA